MARDDVEVALRLKNAKKFQSDADRSGKAIGRMGGNVRKAGLVSKRTSAALRGLGRAALKGGMAFGALAAVVGVKSVRAFEQQRKITRQTAQVIKTTGGAANISAKGVAKLSGSLATKSGIDDDIIQGGANMLLTFKKVRNEAGKGNDMFTQSTTAAVDLSAGMTALGKNMSVAGAATMLGKAMNDPVKGMNAMSRAGITFTKQEKEKITALVESGKTLEAQKKIMAAVTEQFGGQAAALASPVDRMRQVVGELGESIGQKLMPFVDKAANAIAKFAGQMQNGTGAGGKLRSAAVKVGSAIMRIARGARSAANWLREHKSTSAALAVVLGGTMGALAAYKLAVFGIAVVTRSWAKAQKLLNIVMKANPIWRVIALLILLGAAVAAAYRRYPKFAKVVDAAWKGIKAATGLAVDFIKSKFESLKSFVQGFLDILGKVKSGIQKLPGGSAIVGDSPGPLGRAAGGFVPGVGRGDRTHMLAEPGEYVVRRQAAQALGPAFMANLNRGNVPAVAAASSRDTVVNTSIQLDGREVARSTSRHVADRQARR